MKEAIEAIRQEHLRIAAKERRGRRVVITLAVSSVMFLSVTVLTLGVIVLRLLDTLGNFDERDECYDRLTTAITVGSQQGDAIQNALFIAIARSLGDDATESPLTPSAMVSVADALALNDAGRLSALERRNEWLAAGRPLPCPISAEGVLATVTLPPDVIPEN